MKSAARKISLPAKGFAKQSRPTSKIVTVTVGQTTVRKVVQNKPQGLDALEKRDAQRIQLAFGENLRNIRHAKLKTSEEIAEEADISANYLNAVERGERNLGLYNIWRIARALGVPASELMATLPSK
jgi:DNA-binding XRE family transcriptional regulator